MESFLVRWLVWIALFCLAFGAGMIKGCERASRKYEQAETKFLIKEKEVIKIEKQEVVRVKTEIKTVHEIITQLVEKAREETPNPTSCDLSTTRVQRINQGISESRKVYDAGVSGDFKTR